jgi:hypothetical protein
MIRASYCFLKGAFRAYKKLKESIGVETESFDENMLQRTDKHFETLR